ncbi:MAG: hypothetical protein ACOCX4_04555 [Planctomycetota bacterium]
MKERSRLGDAGCAGLLAGLAGASILLLLALGPDMPKPVAKAAPYLRVPAPPRAGGKKKKGPAKPWTPPKPTAILEEAPGAVAEAIAETAWTLAYEDRFDRIRLGDDWEIIDGDWSLQNDRLVCNAPSGLNCIAVCTALDLGETYRITYRCRFRPTNKPIVDLSFAANLRADQKKNVLEGYLFRVGSWDNTYSGLGGPEDVESLKNTDVRVKSGAWYTVVCTRVGKHLKLTLDGRTVFAVRHENQGELPGRLGGFYVFRGIAEFDWIRVETPKD